jgi:hypothetical protein
MRLRAIIGTAIAAFSLAACASSVAPKVSPTLEATVSPTIAPTVSPTLDPTAAPTFAPTPTASPAPPTLPPGPAVPPPGPPILTALCAPSPMEFAWQVSFGEPESNYNVDLSFSAGGSFTTEEASATQPYTFDTPNAEGLGVLIVRWDSFPSAGMSTGTNPDSDLCNPALLPPPTIYPVCRAGSSVYSWQVSSDTEQVNWNIDISNSLAGTWTFVSAGGNAAVDFNTPTAAGKTLYVRWAWYPDAGTSTAQADTTTCH